jgi:hypothetical protein
MDAMNEQIAEKVAVENRNMIVNNFKQYSDDPEKINKQEMWKLLKKLWPKSPVILPTAKRNHKGKIISCPTGIKNIGLSEVRALPVRRCRRAAWQTLVATINGIILSFFFSFTYFSPRRG